MTKLILFTDPICPWCYLGKARLERALAARPGHPFELEWHPFMLNPETPPEGYDRREYLERRLGSKEAVVRAHLPLLEGAEEIGLPLDLGAIERLPSTLDAHRLTHWAHLEGCQTEVASALASAYFSEGRDIGDREVLADIAAEAGMDRTAVLRLLASDADADDIRARDADARAKGVKAVPTFVLGNQYVIEGAQPAEFWLQVIDELALQPKTDDSANNPDGVAGPTC